MYPSTQEQAIAFYTRSGHRLINDTSSFTVVGTRTHDQLKSNDDNLHFSSYRVRDSSLQAFEMMLACAGLITISDGSYLASFEPAVWRTSTSLLAFRRIDACRKPLDDTHVRLGRAGQGLK